MTSSNAGNVIVSFELYFLNDLNKWQKAEADNKIPVSMFTTDSLNELKHKSEILYEVE